jgi:twinkle protein
MTAPEILRAERIELRLAVSGNHKTRCPRCSAQRKKNRDPCLSVRIDGEGVQWHCHNAGCDTAGVSSMTGMLSEAHQKWLEEDRALDPELVTRQGLYTDRQSQGGPDLVFPYMREGKIINRKYRGPGKRFRQDKDAPRAFYNEDCLRDPTLADYPLVITEGEIDALSAIMAGHPKTVSVPDGAGTNLDFIFEEPTWPLVRDTAIIIAVDNDQPGQKLRNALACRLGPARCSWPDFPEGAKDLNDVLRVKGIDAVHDVIHKAKPYPIRGLYRLSELPEVGEPVTFETGFPSLNAHLRLWHGEFIVITGIPSHGKSCFALELLCSMALNHKHRAVIFSAEMRIKPYVRDVLREHFCNKWAKDFTLADKRAADTWIEETFMFIDQDPREEQEEATIEWLIDKASDAVVRYGVNWFLLDPWNQVEHKRERGQSEADYQGKAIAALKRFARSYNCGVIVVAHPTKDVKLPSGEIRKPTLYDISGSSHWYNAADHGIVVMAEDTTSSVREISIDKSRYRSGGIAGSGFLKLEDGRSRSTTEAVP